MRRLGKKSAAWANTRRKLKIEFERNGITRCEICSSDFGLSFAHSRKRKDIKNDEQMKHVALLCLVHHQELEILPPPVMYERITAIIEARN